MKVIESATQNDLQPPTFKIHFSFVSVSITDFHFANERFDVLFHLGVYHPPYSGMHLSLGLDKKTELKVKCTDSILILTFPHNDAQCSNFVTIMLTFIF
jgi:hypothetical protein